MSETPYRVALYRKAGVARPKASERKAAAERAERARVARPLLVAFLCDDFWSMTPIDPAAIPTPWSRFDAVKAGEAERFLVPNESTRKTQGDVNSDRQAVHLWVKKWMPEMVEAVSFCLDDF